MQDFPHHYSVAAGAQAEGPVVLSSEGLPDLASAAPQQFGGPGDRWSPETLLVAAVADCFILSFRAIARASKLAWTSLECRVEGTLDRVDRAMQFTAFRVHASLRVAPGVSEEQARRILEKAERSCLISNSLKAPSHLEAEVRLEG
jgi:organic hydroperoxide reductase OsmC/OhrA